MATERSGWGQVECDPETMCEWQWYMMNPPATAVCDVEHPERGVSLYTVSRYLTESEAVALEQGEQAKPKDECPECGGDGCYYASYGDQMDHRLTQCKHEFHSTQGEGNED